MMERYNIQISIQKVADAPISGAPKGLQQAISGKDRLIVNVADIKVTADSEDEAYLRAHKLLDASRGTQ